MAKFLVKVIEILDGTPAEYGKRPYGQSVVELALVTPLLIVLFASMVEIGWFANNYLTMLDATRSGARVATGLQDTRSPLQWDNRASLVPDSLLTNPDDQIYRMSDASGTDNLYRQNYRPALNPGAPRCVLGADFTGFYNEVACRTINALDPLSLRNLDEPDHEATDDVVVSGFALQVMKGNYLDPDPGHPVAHPVPSPADATQSVVVGRYPTNANECEIDAAGNARPSSERDPFDLNSNGYWDVHAEDISTNATIAGYQTINPIFEEVSGFDPYDAARPERQVGFSWYGNHRITGTGATANCIGSRWSIADVQALVNLPSYLTQGSAEEQETRRELMPNQGIAMVELYWEHKPLLNLPFFEPIFRVFSDRATIEVWAAFPLPAVEPFIQFDSP